MEHVEQIERNDEQNESNESNVEQARDGITISGSFNIVVIQFGSRNEGGIHPQLMLRAEGGAQINKDVGTTATQGGQNAIDHSQSENNQSQFADGNGRSGIAGSNNDEAGGQQGIKVRDSKVIDSKIGSSSEQSQGGDGDEAPGEEPVEGSGEQLDGELGEESA